MEALFMLALLYGSLVMVFGGRYFFKAREASSENLDVGLFAKVMSLTLVILFLPIIAVTLFLLASGSSCRGADCGLLLLPLLLLRPLSLPLLLTWGLGGLVMFFRAGSKRPHVDSKSAG
jgi:hypothetical protein